MLVYCSFQVVLISWLLSTPPLSPPDSFAIWPTPLDILLLICVGCLLIALLRSRALRRTYLSSHVPVDEFTRLRSALMQLATSEVLFSGETGSAMRELVEIASATLNVELVSVWRLEEKEDALVCLDAFYAPKNVHYASPTLTHTSARLFFDSLRASRIHLSDSARLSELAPTLEQVSNAPPLSGLHASIYVGGRLFGVLSLYNTKHSRQWKADEQSFACSVADMVAMAVEVSERKRLQNELMQSQKMEALGQLAGGIAHDFNNLMTGILGYTTLLKMTAERMPEVSRNAELIERAALRATELTQKLLGFARKGKHQNIPINVHATIRETVALLARTFERNISILLRLRAQNPFVRGDPLQIQQVIMNLALNARDAMRPELGGHHGGELTIETENSLEAQIRVGVRDTGCGIAEDQREKIFEPFYTTKGEGKGTGMGLAMVYGILENHGGTIEVHSTPGIGSVFRFTLPTYNGPLTEVIEKVSVKPSTGHGQILVVDDHQIVRDVTYEMLTSLGYQVVTACDGIEAVEYFRENAQDIDLVIIDLVMPRMGARECLREIRRIDPYARAILSTGYVNNHLIQELLSEGMAGFVQKPYQLKSLSEVVADALRE